MAELFALYDLEVGALNSPSRHAEAIPAVPTAPQNKSDGSEQENEIEAVRGYFTSKLSGFDGWHNGTLIRRMDGDIYTVEWSDGKVSSYPRPIFLRLKDEFLKWEQAQVEMKVSCMEDETDRDGTEAGSKVEVDEEDSSGEVNRDGADLQEQDSEEEYDAHPDGWDYRSADEDYDEDGDTEAPPPPSFFSPSPPLEKVRKERDRAYSKALEKKGFARGDRHEPIEILWSRFLRTWVGKSRLIFT